MKKFLLVLVILAVIGGAAFAYEPLGYSPAVDGGSFLLDFGAAAYWNLGDIRIPPLFIIGEYAIKAIPLSVGGLAAFFMYGGSDWKEYDIIVSGRANWHFGFNVSWLDFYAGFDLGAKIILYRDSDPLHDSTYAKFSPGGQVGAHFYFTRVFGLDVEIGIPWILKLGLAFKF